MLSVSTTATWSRTTPGATGIFWALQFDKMSDEGNAFAPGDTRVARQRFAVCDGFGAVWHRREEIQHPALHGDARDQQRLDLPLGGSSFHHPLAFSCRRVRTRSLADTLGHTPWCNLLTCYFEHKSQPPSPSSSPSSQLRTCLAATVCTTPAPGRGATP